MRNFLEVWGQNWSDLLRTGVPPDGSIGGALASRVFWMIWMELGLWLLKTWSRSSDSATCLLDSGPSRMMSISWPSVCQYPDPGSIYLRIFPSLIWAIFPIQDWCAIGGLYELTAPAQGIGDSCSQEGLYAVLMVQQLLPIPQAATHSLIPLDWITAICSVCGYSQRSLDPVGPECSSLSSSG